jgi:adenylosuccinate synthase
MGKDSIQVLAHQLRIFSGILRRAFDNHEVMAWCESKGYTALDINAIQLELREYHQTLMAVLRAQSEIVNEAEDALFALVMEIAKTVDLSVDFGDTAISTVVSWKTLARARDVLGGVDGIQKRSAKTKVPGTS